MKQFLQILKEKRDYYGNTEAAIDFAVSEFTQELQQRIAILERAVEYTPVGNKTITTIVHEWDMRLRKEYPGENLSLTQKDFMKLAMLELHKTLSPRLPGAEAEQLTLKDHRRPCHYCNELTTRSSLARVAGSVQYVPTCDLHS